MFIKPRICRQKWQLELSNVYFIYQYFLYNLWRKKGHFPFSLNQLRPKLHSIFRGRNPGMWESPNLGSALLWWLVNFLKRDFRKKMKLCEMLYDAICINMSKIGFSKNKPCRKVLLKFGILLVYDVVWIKVSCAIAKLPPGFCRQNDRAAIWRSVLWVFDWLFRQPEKFRTKNY